MTETLREIGASVSKLNALLSESKKDLQRIQTLQTTLVTILDSFWANQDVYGLASSPALWKETLSMISSGRVLAVAAQADEAIASAKTIDSKSWISDGRAYARWIGSGVSHFTAKADKESREELWLCAAQLTGKSFSLGYADDLVAQILDLLLFDREPKLSQFQKLTSHIARFEQRHFVNALMNLLSTKFFPLLSDQHVAEKALRKDSKEAVAGVAALLKYLSSNENTNYEECLMKWLARFAAANTKIYRAIITSSSMEKVEELLEMAWTQFGDKLIIKHNPIAQQEVLAQIVLIAAGRIHRENPMHVYMLAHSSMHTSGISDRLAASSVRARQLGMMVGMVISKLVDKPELRMKFEIELSEQAEMDWYESLASVEDRVGSLEDLRRLQPFRKSQTVDVPRQKTANIKTTPRKIDKPKIIEVVEDDEDDDLVPYQKPDSDPEDEEEDATLVNREVIKAPVYIRDLITGLKDSENYDRHHLALSTAASLIRRKADFGSEVKDRTQELASILTGLGDTFNTDNFHTLRLQSMLAVLIASPQDMGPWYANACFTNDYSIGQKVGILTTLGLGARELAGFNADEVKKEFPTKTLPERLHRLYADSIEINELSRTLEDTMIRPVATKKRRKMIRNDLSRIVAESFFFPLAAGWLAQTQRLGLSSSHLSHHLLPAYLKTLSIILSAAGPSTPSLPQMTTDFWALLLSMRTAALNAATTLEALLFALLSLLNVNEDKRRIAEQHSDELVETHTWTQMVFEKTSEVDEEGQRIRTLAAGVLMATKEVVDKQHRLMMGSMVDFEM